MLVSLSPYRVLDVGRIRCDNCGLASYDQSFGVVLVVRAAAFIPFKPPRAALVADED